MSTRPFWKHLYCRAFSKGSVPAEDAGPTHDSDLAIDGHHFSHLKRQLGFMQLTLLGIGGSIGAGVFSLSGVAATKAGPAVIFSFLFAGLIAAIDALCYAEMASRYPQAGTVFLYTHLTFGELPALLLALNLLLDYHVAASLIARSFAIYLVEFLKHLGLTVPVWVSSFHVTQVISLSFIAPLLLLVLTVILCRGTETGAWVNMVLTTIKICVILLVIVMGTIHINPSNWLPFAPMGFGQVLQTSSTVFFSFVGFDTIAASSEECKDPLRELPAAIMVSLGVCATLYAAVCLVITGMIPYTEIDVAAPLSSAFAGAGLKWVQAVISFGGVVGLATTLLIGLFAQSRIYLGIARDGLLPPFLAELHPVWKTPLNAQVLCGGLAMTLAAVFNVKLLAELLDIGVILAYGGVCACVLVTRSSDRVYTTRWLLVLIVAAAVPFTIFKYNVLPGGAPDQSWLLWLLRGLLLILPLAALLPLIVWGNYPAPAAGMCFVCPFMPYIPLAGILLNVYLAVNLTMAAWVRLLVLWTGLLCWYVWSEKKYHASGETRGSAAGGGGGRKGKQQRGGRGGGGECTWGDEGDGAVNTSASSDSLRRRSSAKGGGGGDGVGSPLRTPLVGEDAV